MQKITLSSTLLLACGLALTVAFSAQAVPERDGPSLSAIRAADRAALALHFAPIHYQDVDTTGATSLGGAADFIARYDFDGDLDARNNWENAGSGRFSLAAAAYYSVVETRTHWYLVYLFFHPRDWVDHFFDTEHENDAEGLLLSVTRDGTRFGTLKAAVTVAHKNFYSYVPFQSDWKSGRETVDGRLRLEGPVGDRHPVTAQQSKGHGLKAWPYYNIEGKDGVVYYPSLVKAEAPSSPSSRHVSYQLIDIFAPNGMWANRDNPMLFAKYGSFAGNKSRDCGNGTLGCTTNAANAPWAWNDRNDDRVAGALALDPAGLVKQYFTIPERVSTRYTFNPYSRSRDGSKVASLARRK